MTANYTITFACYNQLDYTQQFIASLDRAEVDFSRIVAVDNGSTDGTRDWLQQQGFGAVILNERNLGCGAAWNQGALAIQSPWTIVMNNDVVCAKGWLRNLIQAAEQHQLKICSPAMVEGMFDYNLSDWVSEATNQMQGYVRHGVAHAVCMAIHEDVWAEIGYFMPVPKLLGYEDGIFFQRALERHLAMGITSESWLHHYGMITQKALKLEMALDQRDSLGNRNLMRLYMAQTWLARKLARYQRRRLLKAARESEFAMCGKTVHALHRKAGAAWDWV
jgi:glycosyltransferase involved in cell wall biosynthesis